MPKASGGIEDGGEACNAISCYDSQTDKTLTMQARDGTARCVLMHPYRPMVPSCIVLFPLLEVLGRKNWRERIFQCSRKRDAGHGKFEVEDEEMDLEQAGDRETR